MLNLIDRQFLIASIGERSFAREAWENLVGTKEFGKIQDEYLRFLARIYWNLHSNKEISHYTQLRGVYKHSWTKNVIGLTHAQKLVEGLHDYRILKGFGVALSTGNLGIRSMGDLDILVSKNAQRTLIRKLEETGFTPVFNVGCTLCTKKEWRIHAQSWINLGGFQIDVHVPGAKTPTKLFEYLIKAPFETRQFREFEFCVPIVEDLITHSVIHGSNGSHLDYLQSCIDVFEMSKMISRDRLQAALASSGMNERVVEILQILADATGEDFGNINLDKTIASLNKTSLHDFSLRHITAHFRTRSHRLRDLMKAGIYTPQIKSNLIYRTWVLFGRLRPIESRVMKYLGGFMKTGRNNGNPMEFLGEVRLRIPSGPTKEVVIKRKTKLSIIQPKFLVFLDSDLVGMLEEGDSLRVEIDNESRNSRDSELSIRKPHRSCIACAERILDEELDIDFIAQP